VVGSQIDTLIHNISLCHNSCYKYSNGSCKPILDIYISRSFQWYKELLNPMILAHSNRSLKIWKSIETLTPKVETHLGMSRLIPSRFPTFLGVWMWLLGCILDLHLFMPLVLVMSPRLGLWHHLFPTIYLPLYLIFLHWSVKINMWVFF
jgi:hypothetical protein